MNHKSSPVYSPKQVAENSQKVGQLVGEIAAASREQADGIGQVNKAVVEMDKVTQQNTATSEESAASAEQLAAHANHLRHLMERFKTSSSSQSRLLPPS